MKVSNLWKQAEPAPRYFSNLWKTGLLLIGLSLNATAQIEGMEITGFRVPEYDAQGQMTSQMFGERAVMGSNGIVKIDGVRVEFYQDGEVLLEASAPYCFYNRETGRTDSDAPVRAEMEGFLLTGQGFDLEPGGRTVHVQDECRVEINDVMQQTDLDMDDAGGESTNLTVITSEELYLDYDGRSAEFVDSVHVDDSKMMLDSGSLKISFSENNEIDWIQATNDVRILSDGREAYADKAVYDIKTDEFVLEGNPRLVDGENTLLGDRIRFWRASEKMVCEQQADEEGSQSQDDPEPKKRATLVIYPNEDMDTKLFETP